MPQSRLASSLLPLAAALASVASTSCHRAKTYESTVEVTRISVARTDQNGRATLTDVELSYVDCPGTQLENVRGGEEFSSCISKLAVGTRVPVKVEHRWSSEGFYTWDVHQVADCKRPPDPNDEASFATVRECEEWKANGVVVGFECQISPKKALLQKCPWFARR